ncbi:MAG: hypothetical protein Kow00105_17600 [Phycisphaeraceae bacterium]
MTDRYDQNLILGYIEGELDDEQRESFEIILAHDHELRNLVAQMKLDRDALRRLGPATAPEGLLDQVMQTQERAALLGEPDTSEPIPLNLPVNRHKLRRVLIYSGVAAVLLLSAAIIVPTLRPSRLIEHPSRIVLNNTTPEYDEPMLDEDTAVAVVDEDAVYDNAGPTALGLSTAETGDSVGYGGAPLGTKPAESDSLALGKTVSVQPKDESADTTALLDALPADTDPVEDDIDTGSGNTTMAKADSSADSETPETADLPAPVAAMTALTLNEAGRRSAAESTTEVDSDADTSTSAASATRETERISDQPALAEAVVSEDTAPASAEDVRLAMSDADQPAFKQAEPDRSADTFAGYAADDLPEDLQNQQLVILSPSPFKARRDLRDWAMNHGVVVMENRSAVIRRARAAREAGQAEPRLRERVLTIEIDPDQVPALLTHLNQTPTQRARLAPLESREVLARTDSTDGRSAGRDITSKQGDETQEEADRVTALTNRMVDTQSGWAGTGLASGLTPESPARGLTAEPRQSEAMSSVIEHDPQPGGQADRDSSRSQDVFDWSHLLDRVARKPLLTPPAKDRVRLQVLIRQVADPVETSDDANDTVTASESEASTPDTPSSSTNGSSD